MRQENGQSVAYPDTLVGTDSHTTMINGLGVLGWGVGGIEGGGGASRAAQSACSRRRSWAFACMGRCAKRMPAATDAVLTVTQLLRQHGVVDQFVEFFGAGLSQLRLPDRATISNMCPEYGATAALFPVDDETLRYLRLTGRSEETVQLVERYTKEQGLLPNR